MFLNASRWWSKELRGFKKSPFEEKGNHCLTFLRWKCAVVVQHLRTDEIKLLTRIRVSDCPRSFCRTVTMVYKSFSKYWITFEIHQQSIPDDCQCSLNSDLFFWTVCINPMLSCLKHAPFTLFSAKRFKRWKAHNATISLGRPSE